MSSIVHTDPKPPGHVLSDQPITQNNRYLMIGNGHWLFGSVSQIFMFYEV